MSDAKNRPLLDSTAVLPVAGSAFGVNAFGVTDCGKVRPANEDHFLIAELARTLKIHATSLPHAKAPYSCHRGHVFLVADGMGGHQAGETASALTLITIEAFLLDTLKRFFRLKAPPEQHILREFQDALRAADARLFEEAAEHPELQGMATTLTMAFAVNWKLYVAHAGDSRCYLFSGGRLQQVTNDHTVAAELTRQGMLSPTEAAVSQMRHVVTNALGGHHEGVKAELHQLDLTPGDVVLLCSDGLTGMVDDSRIAGILKKEPDPRKACAQLLDEANAKGGKDNITVLLARFEAA